MANEQVNIGTSIAAVIEQVWKPEFGPQANEERVVTRGFSGADGIQKIGRTLNVSKVSTVTAQTLAVATGAASRVELIYDNATQLNKSALAVRLYTGVQIPVYTKSQLLRYDSFIEVYKQQLVKSLVAKIDTAGAGLYTSIATNIIGGAGQDISELLLTSGISRLATSGKEFFSPGRDKGYLTVHPAQIDNVLMTDKIVNAYIRGDSADPIVKGWVWDAYNLNMMESGNIAVSGGLAMNILHIPQAFILGYNEEPHLIPPQDNGLLMVQIATAEYVVIAFFEEYSVLIQTQSV